MRLFTIVIIAVALAVPAAAGADGARAPGRIATDAELRRVIAGTGPDAIDAERVDRFAERLDLNLDRIRARQGTLPLAAQQELRHARQDLNTLKIRAPHHPEIPFLERELSRAKRRAR